MKNATVKLKAIMDKGSVDPHFGAGLWHWITFMDRVYAPPVMDGVHGHLFLSNEKWTKTEIVQKQDLKNNNKQCSIDQ